MNTVTENKREENILFSSSQTEQILSLIYHSSQSKLKVYVNRRWITSPGSVHNKQLVAIIINQIY